MQKEAYEWLTQGKRRKKIIAHLKQPMTAKQLAQITGMREDCCSYVLQELSAYRLVYCLNWQARRSRLYWLTGKGKQCQKKILKTHGLPIYAYDFPIVDWKLTCMKNFSETEKANSFKNLRLICITMS